MRAAKFVAVIGVALVLLGLGIVMRQSLAVQDLRPGTSGVPASGWDPREPLLTQAALGSGGFHQVHDVAVRGQIFAQPVVFGSTVLVATETNDVYGVDRGTGTIRWHRSLGRADTTTQERCPDQISPSEGITSTPVVDPATGTAYLTTRILGDDGRSITWQMHALLVEQRGSEPPGWPVVIQGAASNAASAQFEPRIQRQRAGLLLVSGRVFAAFGGICDEPPYRGWIAGVSTGNGVRGNKVTMWTDESGTCTDREACAGIWMGGSPLVADGPDRIFVSTGNGAPPRPGSGREPPGQLGNAVVRLRVNLDGTLVADDFFASQASDQENAADLEIGSAGPLVLPTTYGVPSHPRLLIVGSKSGRIFLLDRDDLGGRSKTDDLKTALSVFGSSSGKPEDGYFSRPAAWPAGHLIYLVPGVGRLSAYMAMAIDGVPTLTRVASAPAIDGAFNYFGQGSPVVTSDQTREGSGLVWLVTRGAIGNQIRAYAADPVGDQLALLFSAPVGPSAKFVTPLITGGEVFVPGAAPADINEGHLRVFAYSTEEFVKKAFVREVGRQPRPEELVADTSFNATAARLPVARRIFLGEEAAGRRVDATFLRALGRPPSASERTTWTTALQAPGGQEMLLDSLASSNEYFNARGHGRAVDYAAALSEDFLGRGATAAETAGIVSGVAAGRSRADIVGAIAVSREHLAAIVRAEYRVYLGRDADPQGLENYVNAMLSGRTEEDIATILLSSDEYLRLATASDQPN